MDDRYWILKRCPLFERLSPDEIAGVERASQARQVARGGLVYLPADDGNAVYLVAAGRIKLYHLTADGKQAVLALIEPGELFGELAVLDRGPREEFAEAMETATVVRIPLDAFERLMTAHPDVALGVTRLIGWRRRRIERRLKSLLFRSNRERLIALLVELAETYGQRTEQGVQLGVRLSHQELASIIGSTRESVTVELGNLQAEGALRIQRRRICLSRLESLARSIGLPVPKLPVRSEPPLLRPSPAASKCTG